MKTELENKIIKECLKSVLKTIHKSSFVNSYGISENYINQDEFEYNLLSDEAIKVLKNLVENY